LIALTLVAIGGLSPATVRAEPPGPAIEPSLPYTVQPADRLITLARELLADPRAWPEVARFNRMADPDRIRPGQRVLIPLRLLKHRPAPGRLLAVTGEVLLGERAAVAGADVAEGDRLRTGANSSAVLRMADGTVVKLLPTTLAEVASQRDYLMRDPGASIATTWYSGAMRILQGALETHAHPDSRRAEPMRVIVPTSVIGVRGTVFRVAYDEAGGRLTRAEVTAGQVRADNTVQRTGADLPAGTGAVLDPARPQVRAVPLLAAPDLSALPAALSRPATAWPLPPLGALPGAVAWRVQVAGDPQFNTIVRDRRVDGSAALDLADLPDGTWLLRVRGVDAEGLEGFDAVTRVTLAPAPPPPPPAPRLRLLSSALSLQGGSNLLRWNVERDDGQPLKVAAWRLVIARDTDLRQDRREWTGSEPAATLPLLPPGSRWHARLAARLADGTELAGLPLRLLVPAQWGTTVFDSSAPLQPD